MSDNALAWVGTPRRTGFRKMSSPSSIIPGITALEKPLVQRTLAIAALEVKNFTLAASTLEDLIQEMPEGTPVEQKLPLIESLLNASQQAKDLPKLVNWARIYLKLEGDNPSVRPVLIQTLSVLNRHDEVVQEVKEKIRLDELERQWHFSTLEKLFINNEMYIDFKHYHDRESLYEYLYKRFEPFKKQLIREITDEDLHKLTQIPMIRITRFDGSKADELLLKIEEEIEEVKNNLNNIIEYSIEYFKEKKRRKKYAIYNFFSFITK